MTVCVDCFVLFYLALVILTSSVNCQPKTGDSKQLTEQKWTKTSLFEDTVVPYRDEKTMAVITYTPDGRSIIDCTLFDLEKELSVANDLLKKRKLVVVECNFQKMMRLINQCKNISTPALHDLNDSVVLANVTELWSLWRGIIPGTKWCGLGDEARSYNDIGPKFSVDNCCRAHDHCPVRIKPFHYGYGLINFSVYTKSHCECDDEFLLCLRQTNHPLADIVGNFYFNVMQFGCIRESSENERMWPVGGWKHCRLCGRSSGESSSNGICYR